MLGRLRAAGLATATVVAGLGCASQDSRLEAIEAALADQRTSATVCELHGASLVEDSVPLSIGLSIEPAIYWEGLEALFPRHESWAEGGCVIWEGMPTESLVRYCPACRDAFDAWAIEHPDWESAPW